MCLRPSRQIEVEHPANASATGDLRQAGGEVR